MLGLCLLVAAEIAARMGCGIYRRSLVCISSILGSELADVCLLLEVPGSDNAAIVLVHIGLPLLHLS